MEQKHQLSEMMETTMTRIKEMVDANTIIGQPIVAPNGTMIIPVSKASFGFASAGSDFEGKSTPPKSNFGGGSGAGVTISPIAFLVVEESGVRVIPVGAGGDPTDKLASLVPEMFDKVVGLVKSAKKKKEPETDTPAE